MNYETALALWCIAGFCLNCAISFWVNKKLVVLDLVMCAIGSAMWPLMLGAALFLKATDSGFWTRRIL